MSLLVAIKSCHRDRIAGFHDAIRSTWGKDFPKNVIVRFFQGENPDRMSGSPMKKDEIVLDCKDDYMSLPFKTRGICQWALPKNINHIFLCDNDTFVKPSALMKLLYEPFDYAGHFKGGDEEIGKTFYYQDHRGEYPNCYTWASGGWGYFLSISAAIDIVDSFPKVWAEDMYVGQVLGPEIARGQLLGKALPLMNNATWHFRKSEKHPIFTPELLYRIYKDGGPEKLYAE